MTTAAVRAKAATPTEKDYAVAEGLLERLGGALSLYDIYVIRAASVWHYTQWELAAERDGGLDSDWQKSPVLDAEQKRAVAVVGMPARLPTYRLTRTCVRLDPGPVQEQLNRAEVAVAYLFALHGVRIEDRPPSYPSTDYEPAFGPMDVIEVWDKLAAVDPSLKLSDDESAWTSCSLDKDDSES